MKRVFSQWMRGKQILTLRSVRDTVLSPGAAAAHPPSTPSYGALQREVAEPGGSSRVHDFVRANPHSATLQACDLGQTPRFSVLSILPCKIGGNKVSATVPGVGGGKSSDSG